VCRRFPILLLLTVFLTANFPAVMRAVEVTNSPAIATNLPLRGIAGEAQALNVLPLPDTPPVAVTLPPLVSVADAQLSVIRAPENWRSWAALARAHYKVGDYEKARAASLQMRAAAAGRNEPLPLAADELYERCRRAAEALTILE
jgi:hypothetical protein